MKRILGAVFQQHATPLLDMVFGDSNGLKAVGDHVHHIGIARDFLFIATRERFAPLSSWQLFNASVSQFSAFDAGG